MTITEHNGKQFVPLRELRNWAKNPRSITKQDFDRLKSQITKLGCYKPLIVTPDGTVLGGNMRLRAYQELGITEVWVSVVEPKTEQEMLEYALSDNDRAGTYEEQALAELAGAHLDLDKDLFHVDLGESSPLKKLLGDFSDPELPNIGPGEVETQSITVYYPSEVMEEVMSTLNKMDGANISEKFLALVRAYGNQKLSGE